MGDSAATPPDSGRLNAPPEVDTTVAHVARAYDYMLGGTANFQVDREAAERLSAVFPGGMETARVDIRTQRDFLGRAVRYLAGDVGIRQFLDIGTGIPNADNVHAVAQQVSPESRIVYVDRDPVVLAHAHILLKGTPEGATAFIQGDLRRPGKILHQAASTLDLSEPVAVVAVGLLHVIPDEDDPYGLVGQLMEAVPSGSYLVVSHLPKDVKGDEMAQMERRSQQMMREPFIMRTHAEVSKLFDGLELVGPGVVQAIEWGRDQTSPPPPTGPDGWVTPLYGAVGRKP